MTNMSIQPLWLTHFIEILLVLKFQLTKFIVGGFSYKACFRPQIFSNGYSSAMKARLAIYNLNGKVERWWRDLRHTKKDELWEVCSDTFQKNFQEKYMSERFFDWKVKEFHKLHMESMTMDVFINIFLDMLHYVPYIKEKKVKIEHILGCLHPSFRDNIEFDMPKNFNTTLRKARLYYEHGKLRHENMNQN